MEKRLKTLFTLDDPTVGFLISDFRYDAMIYLKMYSSAKYDIMRHRVQTFYLTFGKVDVSYLYI